jgi:TolA-binding protein
VWAALLAIAASARAETPTEADPAAVTEIAGYAKLAREAADEEKWPLADHFLGLLGGVDAPDTAKKSAFRGLAEDYEKKHQLARAIAVYEKMIEIYGNDSDTPELIFRVGLLYRESGVDKLAVARFFTVLNSALKFGAKDLAGYRALAQRAQWEIAETFFQAGDVKKAHKYYELLSRLDLPATEKARVQFRIAHCHLLENDVAAAIAAAETFLKTFPDAQYAAECRYLLASALRSQGRSSEAFEAVLALLRQEDERKEMAPEKWIYWKKKAGSEFANFYYQQGDTLSALTIFQSIARLSEEPDWQWPVIYQMGLCFERLRHAGRAAEAYKYIIDGAKKAGGGNAQLSDTLRTLLDMANWRASQLAWSGDATAKLERLLSNPLAVPAAETLKP